MVEMCDISPSGDLVGANTYLKNARAVNEFADRMPRESGVGDISYSRLTKNTASNTSPQGGANPPSPVDGYRFAQSIWFESHHLSPTGDRARGVARVAIDTEVTRDERWRAESELRRHLVVIGDALKEGGYNATVEIISCLCASPAVPPRRILCPCLIRRETPYLGRIGSSK